MPVLIGLKPNIGHVYLDLLVCFIPVVGMARSTGGAGMPKMAFPPPGRAPQGIVTGGRRRVGGYGLHLAVSTARIYPVIHLVPVIPTLWDVCND
jgi:hypothetical protein